MGKDIVESKKSKVWASDEQIKGMLATYAEKGNAGIDEIVEAIPGKNRRKVISKLVALKAYKADEKAPKQEVVNEGPQKKELIAEVGKLTGLEGKTLDGLNGVTKPTLTALVEVIKRYKAD